jgi:hypothetical protein
MTFSADEVKLNQEKENTAGRAPDAASLGYSTSKIFCL